MVLVASFGTSGASTQSVQLKRVMQTKLEHAQRILGDVVTSDWSDLERHAEALRRTTTNPAWAVLPTPEYESRTSAFVRAADDLLVAARRRDLETTPLAYVSLTLSCVQCHRYIARMRIATPE
jgi:hypothetical protein